MGSLLQNTLLATSSPTPKSKPILNDTPVSPLISIQPSPGVREETKKASLTEFENLYNDLQNDLTAQTIGSDPLLQKNAIEKINLFLAKYPNTKANPNYNDVNLIPWTDLPVKELYKGSIKTLVDIINDISDSISENEIDGSVATRRKIVDAFFRKDRRVYVGLLFIFISFILYFIDSTA
jgi:hypothetical protein